MTVQFTSEMVLFVKAHCRESGQVGYKSTRNLLIIVRVCNMKNRLSQNGSTKVSMHSSDCN